MDHPKVPAARELMTTRLVTLAPDLSAVEAAEILLRHSISGAPVVDAKGQLLGLLSEFDCLRAVASAEYEMGLYYYYMSVARTLNAYGESVLEDDRGLKHNWREDLLRQLKSRVNEDGSWTNKRHDRWYEKSPVLCTSYVLDALKQMK